MSKCPVRGIYVGIRRGKGKNKS